MLTDRQIDLLKAIIDAYISTSEPVGSVEVVKRYNLHCSAATIRNEMAKLISLGFLEMPHTSSGRVPTKMAYRMYLDSMMDETDLPVLQEVALKQRLWPNRFHFEKMLREAMIALSEITKALAIATTSDGFMAHAGAVNVLENKEFWEIDSAKAALLLLDNSEMMERVFQGAPYGGDVRCVLEDELGIENLRKSSIVFAPYSIGNRNGHIAVLGPSRINYANIIPAIRYTKKVIEELGEAW
jgi:transcriptional regulator of heat shock response